MEKTYKYRIYPNKKQQELIQKTFDCCNYVYNYFLERKISAYAENKQQVRFYQCNKELTELKKNNNWLYDVDKWALSNTLIDLERGYQLFFKCGYSLPKFKNDNAYKKSYRTQLNNNNIEVFNKQIKLPKLGYVKAVINNTIGGRILNVTIKQLKNNQYYAYVCCTDVEIQCFPKTQKNVGIDLGISNFATFSDGTIIQNPKFYEEYEDKISYLQKKFDNKKTNSKNKEKIRIKIAKIHHHIAEKRKDFIQKLTTKIVKEYDLICIENLNIKSMKNTKNKTKNKHLNDVLFYEFKKELEYKCKWYGKELKIVDRYYPSSQICHLCGHRDQRKDESIREWVCPNCNGKLDRDLNAAINILNEGIKL